MRTTNGKRRERSAPATASALKYATPALDKGLDILELLAQQPAGLTKSEMARQLDRTVSELFRMLICLERRGYIAQWADERYCLTLKLFKLAQEHPPTERLLIEALPLMKRLTHQVRQSCHLGVLDEGRIVILAQANASTNLGFYVKPGSTVDLLDSASGYVILAHATPAERERMLAEWRRLTGKRLPANFDAHVERIRDAGYERRASYMVKGVENISFPVFDERGHALAALTVPYIEHTQTVVPEKKVIQSLGQIAAELSAAIGGRGVAEQPV